MFTARLLPLSAQAHTHAHSHHQLVLGVKGCAEFELAGRGGAVSAQHACLVPGSVAHAFAGQGDNRMLILDGEADNGAEAHVADRHMLTQLFEQPRFATLDADFISLKHYAVAELQRFGHDAHLARALGSMLLRALHVRLFAEPVATQGGRFDVAALQTYVRSQLRRRISVAELAAQVHMSPAHFSACFKQATGQTPYQFVLRERLAEAQRLLRESSASLTAIAEACGFANQAALSHAMRRYLGLSPKHWRSS